MKARVYAFTKIAYTLSGKNKHVGLKILIFVCGCLYFSTLFYKMQYFSTKNWKNFTEVYKIDVITPFSTVTVLSPAVNVPLAPL